MQHLIIAGEVAIIFILGSWLCLNIAYACFNKEMGPYTKRYDLFRWISAFQLFSNTMSRHKLFYCEQPADGNPEEWKALPLFIPWKWYHAVYFPEAVVLGELNSIVDDIARFGPEERLIGGFRYRVLLAQIKLLAPEGSGRLKAFKIVKVTGLPGSETSSDLFISTFDS